MLKQIAQHGNKLKRIQNGQKIRTTSNGLGMDREQITGFLGVYPNLDVAGQESWEKVETRIDIEGYKWFG